MNGAGWRGVVLTVGVIGNPAAGGGRLKRDWPRIVAALQASIGPFELRETKASGEAAASARAFARAGCRLVVAMGGDGTFGEVADGLMSAKAEGAGAAQLGLVPCGSASDFARGLGLPRDPLHAIAGLAGGNTRSLDIGRLRYTTAAGEPATRHFLNIASLGISALIARKVNEDRRKPHLPATALFYWRSASEMLRGRFQPVRISVDDGPAIDSRIALAAICNGSHFGGGMMIAPDAACDDGRFEVVVLRSASRLRLLWDMRLVYGGRHRNHPAIDMLRGRRVVVEPLDASDIAAVEADGEPLGRIPATFELLPAALTLRC